MSSPRITNIHCDEPVTEDSLTHEPIMGQPEGECNCRRCGVAIKWVPMLNGYVFDPEAPVVEHGDGLDIF